LRNHSLANGLNACDANQDYISYLPPILIFAY
jgi:hypothetical protein